MLGGYPFLLAMRPLFIALLPLLFVACDRQSPEPSPFAGQWVLASAEIGDAEVEAPVGSVLNLGASGTLDIFSGNDCSGRFRTVDGGTTGATSLLLRVSACTEIGTTPESDLALFFAEIVADQEGMQGLYENGLQVGAYLLVGGEEPRLILTGGGVRMTFDQG